MKVYDDINRVVITLPLNGLRGYVDTLSPLVAMHHLDGSCVCVGKFFEILRSPTMINVEMFTTENYSISRDDQT